MQHRVASLGRDIVASMVVTPTLDRVRDASVEFDHEAEIRVVRIVIDVSAVPSMASLPPRRRKPMGSLDVA